MNTCHFDDAKLALDAGKHCLLEKASRHGMRLGRALIPARDPECSRMEGVVCAGKGEEGILDGGSVVPTRLESRSG